MSQSTNPITENKQSTYKSWVDCYRDFISISDRILDDATNHDEAHIQIKTEVDALYAQHTGEYIWDEAYRRWYEPYDGDDEPLDEASPILK